MFSTMGIRLSVLALLLVATTAGCRGVAPGLSEGVAVPSSGGTAVSAVGCADTIAGSLEWTARGEELARLRAETLASPAESGLSPISRIPPVQSEPLVIDAPGTYSIRVGPIPADIDLSAQAIQIDFPYDTDDYFSMDLGPWTSEDGIGGQYLVLEMEVTKVERAYPCFTVWVS